MTVSFQQMFGTNSPTTTEVSLQCNTAVCQTDSQLPAVTQDDMDRESRINHHRICMEAAMEEYEKHGFIHDRACADYHRIQFEREIADRSPAQIARMEAEKGLL